MKIDIILYFNFSELNKKKWNLMQKLIINFEGSILKVNQFSCKLELKISYNFLMMKHNIVPFMLGNRSNYVTRKIDSANTKNAKINKRESISATHSSLMSKIV